MADAEGTNTGEAKARRVFLNICEDLLQEEDYAVLVPACDGQVMARVIAIAYKSQFDVDRYPLKKEMRELQDYVVERLLQEVQRVE